MPSLPIELERLIFELAILQDTDRAHKVQIMLVAKRVYEWTRPLLYRVVIVDFAYEVHGYEFVVMRYRNARRMTDIAPFTRHLFCLMCQESQLIELLSTLRNIEDLAIFPPNPITPDVLKSMDGLPLRRISFCPQKVDLSDAVSHCPTLRNVTHFEIMLSKLTSDDFKTLVEFPNLTHLCVDVPGMENEGFEFLKCCPALRVLVFVIDTAVGTIRFDRLRASDEARFLIIDSVDQMTTQDYIGEWGRSIIGEIGFWELADSIVEARQRKLFKVKSPLILSRERWMDNLNDDGIRWYKELLKMR